MKKNSWAEFKPVRIVNGNRWALLQRVHHHQWNAEHMYGLYRNTWPVKSQNAYMLWIFRLLDAARSIGHLSTVAQKCHGNFNSITAILIRLQQFQIDHGNFDFSEQIEVAVSTN